ncbi:MAG: FtsW/RodA/SpoVE family cell cycle protein [Oscillospiraceae bacterium]|nr:FtsW/RodA/SpoVE family cell cycle protein [Oscillospiraceae bacterium]
MKAVLKAVGKAVGYFFRTADIFLLVLCLVCSAFGVALISSASRAVSLATESGGRVLTDISARTVTTQCVAIVIGVILFILLSCVPLDLITRFWKWILAFNILFVLLLFTPWGSLRGGNRSWLDIPGFPISIQPAEVVKVGFLLVLGRQISSFTERERLNSLPSAVLLAAHLGLMIGVVFFPSRDVGMIVVYLMIFFFMCLAGGLKFRWFAIAGVGLAVAGPAIWLSSLLSEQQKNRLLYGFSPELDPLNVGYQPIKAKIAIGGGGLMGQGLFNGIQNMQGSPPEKHTDFIFCVAAEELGFVGCLIILLLLSVIIIRCLYVSTRAKTQLASVVCVGVAGMLLFQTINNVGMNLALTPVIGLTLPFFSYGGSSIIATFAAMGLVSSAYRHPRTHLLSDD